jgi:hypothetical protein
MAFLNNAVLDAALNVVKDDGEDLYITSQEATSYAEATSTYALGSKTGITVGSPASASPDGRRVTIAAITDGAVTGTGTATHWAIIDETNDVLIATGQLTASQAVTTGNSFTLTAFDVRIPAAVNA